MLLLRQSASQEGEMPKQRREGSEWCLQQSKWLACRQFKKGSWEARSLEELIWNCGLWAKWVKISSLHSKGGLRRGPDTWIEQTVHVPAPLPCTSMWCSWAELVASRKVLPPAPSAAALAVCYAWDPHSLSCGNSALGCFTPQPIPDLVPSQLCCSIASPTGTSRLKHNVASVVHQRPISEPQGWRPSLGCPL